MKIKNLFFVAAIALTILGIVGTVKTTTADINSDCPTGCVEGVGGCFCNGVYYPLYAEPRWIEDEIMP